MVKAKKKNGKKQPVTMTLAQLRKHDQEVTSRSLILMIATAMDEFGWTEEDVERFAERLNRYSCAVDEHIITLNKVSEIIEREIGLKAYLW